MCSKPKAEETGGCISNQGKGLRFWAAAVARDGKSEVECSDSVWAGEGEGMQASPGLLASVTGWMVTPLTETGLTGGGMQCGAGAKRMSSVLGT